MLALIGMPRSGTTWVAKVLDSHPSTYYLHEPDTANRMSIPQIIDESEVEKYVPYVDQYLERIEKNDSLKVVGKLPFFPKNYFNDFQVRFNQLSVLASKFVGRYSSGHADHSPFIFKPRKQHITFWKSIESMGRVPVLAKSSIPLKILLLVRHPCAVINSELRGEEQQKFSSSTPIYENWGLFENLLDSRTAKRGQLSLEKLKDMAPSERLAWKWLSYYEILRDQSSNKNCRLQKYEALCTDPHKEFAEVFEFFGLDFHSQVGDYLTQSTSTHSDSYYSTSKNPAKAMDRWKQTLAGEDVALIKSVVENHIDDEHWSWPTV